MREEGERWAEKIRDQGTRGLGEEGNSHQADTIRDQGAQLLNNGLKHHWRELSKHDLSL